MNGGRFDFDDGGTYCGGWEDGKAHGHGVCTGPKGQGEYSGAWHYGFEVSGIYMWPSGNSYEGQWQNGKRHGLGVERRGRWAYRGEWTQGYKGRYGVRHSTNSQAKYEGTWANGLQDGYGVETYADGGTYQGQWLRGMRHGYGIRKSAPYGVAAKYRSRSHAHASLTSLRSDQSEEGNEKDGKKVDDSRGGFVLRARSEPPSRRRSLSERSVAVKRTILQGLRIKKQRSTGDIDQRVNSGGTGSLRSSGSTASCASDESAATGFASHHDHGSFIGADEFVDPNAIESYIGEWKNDKRSGFGVSERSDGLKYEGEWFNNKKYGYGVTTFKDGSKEEGKYKNNVLVTSQRKKNLLFVRTSKLRERIDNAVGSSGRATQIALQKADIAISRSGTAHERADQADVSALQAREDGEIARVFAKQLSPDFNQNAFEPIKKPRLDMVNHVGIQSSKYQNFVSQEGLPLHLQQQQHFIPKLSQLTGDLTNSMSNSLSPDTTPPMLTPPQEVPSNVGIIGAVPPMSMSSIPLSGYDPNSRLLSQQHMQHVQPHPTYSNQPRQVEGPYPTMQGNQPPHQMLQQRPQQQLQQLQQQQQQLQQMRQQTQNLRQMSADSAGHAQPQRPAALLDHRQQNAVDHSRPPAGRKMRDADMEFADADAYPSHMPNRRKMSPTLSRSPSQSSSRHSVNQMMNDYYEQYSSAVATAAHYGMGADGDGSPLISPGGGLVRRSTLGSARDWKKIQEVLSFEMAGESPSTSGLGNVPAGGHSRDHSRDAATAGNRAREVSFAQGTTTSTTSHQKRPKGLTLKQQLSQHRDPSADGARGSVPDLTELVRTPVQMSREEIARLSSQRRQERAREFEDSELLRTNPLRYLRYLFHPAVKAWLVRWKLPLLVLLVNVCLSVIFCQLLTYSNLDKEDLDEND